MSVRHIDSSITEGESVSRRSTARVVDRLSEASPDLTVTYRDLAKHPLPHHVLSHVTETSPGGDAASGGAAHSSAPRAC